MTNITNSEVVFDDLRYVDATDEELAPFRVSAGDVLVNRTNALDLVGRTGTYWGNATHVFASYLIRITVQRDQIAPDYLTAVLNSPFGVRQIRRIATRGVSQANVNATNLLHVRVPLPPITTQRALLAQLTDIDVLASDCARRASESRAMKKKLIAKMLRGDGDSDIY